MTTFLKANQLVVIGRSAIVPPAPLNACSPSLRAFTAIAVASGGANVAPVATFEE